MFPNPAERAELGRKNNVPRQFYNTGEGESRPTTGPPLIQPFCQQQNSWPQPESSPEGAPGPGGGTLRQALATPTTPGRVWSPHSNWTQPVNLPTPSSRTAVSPPVTTDSYLSDHDYYQQMESLPTPLYHPTPQPPPGFDNERQGRPTRTVKLPVKFKDYDVY